MKTSPFQIILFAIFGVAALVGLFIFATYSSRNSSSGEIGSVLIWGTLPEADVNAALTTIVKTQTSLKNVSYEEKDARTMPTDLAAAIATGAAPDLLLVSQEQLRTLAKFITPIPPSTLSVRTFVDTFVAAGGLFAELGGAGYYGIPLLVDPLVLFFNRSILSSNGIPTPPATWEALTGLVPHVALMTSSQQITRGLIAFGTYDNVRNARAVLSSLFLQTGVPIATYSGSGVLSADLGKSAQGGTALGKAVLGFYTQFADPSKVSYTWNASLPDSTQAFLAGDLALYPGYASEARYLREANPNLDFGAAPLPQPATARTKSVYGLVYALMIPNGAPNPNGGFQTAALLSNSFGNILAETTGLAPATLVGLSTQPANPVAALAYVEALSVRGWLSPMPYETDAIFSGMIEGVTSGRLSPDTALTSAESSLSALLQ